MRQAALLALAITLTACTAASQGANRPTATTLVQPLAVTSTSPTATPSIATLSPSPVAGGTLQITPASAPVGTTVLIRGRGCNNPGVSFADLTLEGSPGWTTGTEGAFDLGPVNVASDGSFSYRLTIPSRFAPGSLQGRGGGTLVPGTYALVSHPPYCQAMFTVTR